MDIKEVLNEGQYLEILDRLWMVSSIADTHLLQHPVCKVEKELEAEIELAIEHLCIAYQMAGRLIVKREEKK